MLLTGKPGHGKRIMFKQSTITTSHQAVGHLHRRATRATQTAVFASFINTTGTHPNFAMSFTPSSVMIIYKYQRHTLSVCSSKDVRC